MEVEVAEHAEDPPVEECSSPVWELWKDIPVCDDSDDEADLRGCYADQMS